MPRRRPQIQSTSDHVTAPENKPRVQTKKVQDETPVDVVESKIENEDAPVVEQAPEPEPVKESPVKASKTISTDMGTVETKEEPQPFTPHWSAPDGLILQADDAIKIEGDDYGTYVVVKRDVYREVYPNGAKRPSYFLLYAKGTQVLKSTLQALN